MPSNRVNATHRLAIVLDKMDKYSGNGPVVEVLSAVMNIELKTYHSEYRAYSVLGRMFELSEIEIQSYFPDEWEHTRPHLDGLRGCLNPMAAGLPWSQRRAQLTGSDLTALRLTAIHLKNVVPEQFAADPEMAPVRESIKDMEEALSEEGMSKRTREVLTARLNAIKTALDEYRFWGAVGVKDSFLELIGTIGTDAEVQSSLADEKQGKTIGQKLVSVITTLTMFLTFVNTAHDTAKIVLPPLEKWLLHAPTASHDAAAAASNTVVVQITDSVVEDACLTGESK